jgi:hypothetical protein
MLGNIASSKGLLDILLNGIPDLLVIVSKDIFKFQLQ